jgi:hypothetical protein
MIPRTFPSTYETINGQHRVVVFFLSSVTNLQRWADYIPVKFSQYEGQEVNTYNNEGIQLIDPLTSTTGKQAWLDYIPVYLDNDADDATLVSNTGYIPIGFNVAPSLSLDFTDPSETLDSRITFTRGSTGTRFNSSGVLESVAINTPRFDYDPVTLAPKGLLVEEQRTNLLTYSSEFDNAAWTKTRSSITANTIVAPDGTLTGDKLVEDTTASNTHEVSRTESYTSGTNYTFTIYAKAAERSIVAFVGSNAAFGAVIAGQFNLSTGEAIVGTSGTNTSASMTSVGNGWWRCVFTAQATSTTSGSLIWRMRVVSGQNNYTGDGYSGLYLWGAQLEAGAFPTSYIPTVAATATRNADVASMTGTNFSSWYRADEGTFFVDWTAGQDDVFINAWSVGSTVVNGGFMNMRRGNTGNLAASIIDGTVTQSGISIITGSPIAGTTYKAVSAYKVNDFAAVANGGAVGTDTSGTVPSTIGTLLIGNGWSNGGATAANEYLNSTIRKIAYYPSRLSNAQLQALTR